MSCVNFLPRNVGYRPARLLSLVPTVYMNRGAVALYIDKDWTFPVRCSDGHKQSLSLANWTA